MTISKKIGFLLLTIASFYSCKKKQECNCKDFKTGKFEFTQEINGKKETTLFERTDKLQIETYHSKTDTSTIRWVNDCEFVIQKLHPKNMAEEKAIDMRILSTTSKSYLFEFGIVGSDKKQRGVVTKLD